MLERKPAFGKNNVTLVEFFQSSSLRARWIDAHPRISISSSSHQLICFSALPFGGGAVMEAIMS